MLDFPWSRAVGRSKNSEVIAVINSRLFDDTGFAYISAKIWKGSDFPLPHSSDVPVQESTENAPRPR